MKYKYLSLEKYLKFNAHISINRKIQGIRLSQLNKLFQKARYIKKISEFEVTKSEDETLFDIDVFLKQLNIVCSQDYKIYQTQ